MANLILASKREIKGVSKWHVYRSENNTKSGEFYFAEPLKALRYAFILRKRTGAIIPKPIYNKLMADVQAAKQAAPATEQAPEKSAPEQAPAPEQVPDKPAKKRTKKGAKQSEPAAEAAGEPSPIASQYEAMKAKHPDSIVLIRTRDFYTAYADDAKAVSDICGVTLTQASTQDITRLQSAFPAHLLDSFLPRLVRAGKRVCICDELTAPEK